MEPVVAHAVKSKEESKELEAPELHDIAVSESTDDFDDASCEQQPGDASFLSHSTIKAQKWLIRLLAFGQFLSFSILATTMTQLLLLSNGNNFSAASSFLGMVGGIERAVSFFTGPILGKLSDSYGRKPIMLWSMGIHLASLIILASKPNPTTIFVYHMLHSVCCTMGMTSAMVTDWTLLTKTGCSALTQQFGRLGFVVGIAGIMGTALGPFLSEKVNPLIPLYIAIGAVGGCLIVLLFVVESLPVERRIKFEWKESHPFKNIMHAFKFHSFMALSGPFLLTQMAESVQHYMVLYTRKRYHWSFTQMGGFMAISAVAVAAIQGNLKRLVPRYLSNDKCVTVGLSAQAMAFFILAFSFQPWVLALVVPMMMLGSLRHPGLMSIMSGSVMISEQGILHGSISSLRTVAKAVGAPMMGAVGAYALRKDVVLENGVVIEGLPFLVGCAMETVGCLLTFLILKYVLSEREKGNIDDEPPEPEKFEVGNSTIVLTDIVHSEMAPPAIYPAPEDKV